MTSNVTQLCQQLLQLNELMGTINWHILQLDYDLKDPNHYVNVFNRHAEWKHKIDIKQRAYQRLLQRFNNIKQQLQ
jgi:hypothetical protein